MKTEKEVTESIYEEVCKQCGMSLKMVNKTTCQNKKCGGKERVLVKTITEKR